MKRRGRVVAALSPGKATVELARGPACRRCEAGRGCGAALFGTVAAPLHLDCVIARDAPNVATDVPECARPDALASNATLPVGTAVEVEWPDVGALWLVPVVLAYGLPTVGLLVGACAPEPWAPVTALIGLGGGVLAWRMIDAVPGRGVLPSCADGMTVAGSRAVARVVPDRDSLHSSGESA